MKRAAEADNLLRSVELATIRRRSIGKLFGNPSIEHGKRFTSMFADVLTGFLIFRLQEKLPDDRMDSGRVPRTIECEVVNDLVDRVIPGDVVEITGIVKVSQSEKSKHHLFDSAVGWCDKVP